MDNKVIDMKTRMSATEKMVTLNQAIDLAVKRGYSENFKVASGGLTTEIENKFYAIQGPYRYYLR